MLITLNFFHEIDPSSDLALIIFWQISCQLCHANFNMNTANLWFDIWFQSVLIHDCATIFMNSFWMHWYICTFSLIFGWCFFSRSPWCRRCWPVSCPTRWPAPCSLACPSPSTPTLPCPPSLPCLSWRNDQKPQPTTANQVIGWFHQYYFAGNYLEAIRGNKNLINLTDWIMFYLYIFMYLILYNFSFFAYSKDRNLLRSKQNRDLFQLCI